MVVGTYSPRGKMELTENKRQELIERIMSDIESNMNNYEKFILDCVKDRVENWENDELLNWINWENEV